MYARCNKKGDTLLRCYMLKREKKYKPRLLNGLFWYDKDIVKMLNIIIAEEENVIPRDKCYDSYAY